jgi:hypothetical protein
VENIKKTLTKSKTPMASDSLMAYPVALFFSQEIIDLKPL